MAKYSAAQIYAFARAAGFDPDQAATMTAIALAESGGRSGAHNTVNENSRGLWQINARAHPGLAAELDLFSPRDNAVAAFRVSRGGRDISPWTTTHGGSRARYLQFREQAQAAAVAHGEPVGLGMWRGTSGYRDPQPAGRHPADPEGGANAVPPSVVEAASSPPGTHGLALAQPDLPRSPPAEAARADTLAAAAQSPDPAASGGTVAPAGTRGIALAAPDATGAPPVPEPGAAGPAAPGEPSPRVERFVAAALDQRGDPYIFGVPTRLSDPNPRAFDCSELVRWAAHQAGIDVPDGSWLQYLHLRKQGLVIPVEEGIRTKGALLFSFSSPPTPGGGRPSHAHVAISLGDETTIEARGRAYGVDTAPASTKRFQYAALLPGMTDSAVPARDPGTALPEAGPVAAGGRLLDTDGDGLTDRLEQRLGLDPTYDNTSGDRLRDSYDLLFGDAGRPAGDVASWSAQLDDALLAGTSATAPGTALREPNLHGLALAQPDERAGPAPLLPDDGTPDAAPAVEAGDRWGGPGSSDEADAGAGV